MRIISFTMKSTTTLIITTVALIVAGVAYWYFFYGYGESTAPLDGYTDKCSSDAV